MKYLFVLGRNVELSKIEIICYFERIKRKINSLELVENGLLVDLGEEEDLDIKRALQELGGCIAIGKVLFDFEEKDMREALNKKNIYFDKEIKFNYSILNFSRKDFFFKICDLIKEKFKREGLKAVFRNPKGRIRSQAGDLFFGSPKKLSKITKNYFLFGKQRLSFGILEDIIESRLIEKRDMEKPERRTALAISPRLAKILINLSGIREAETLLDPFCGVGVILQEALLQGINVIGIDIDEKAISSAKKNIDWLKENSRIEAEYTLIKGDSRKIKLNQNFDSVCFEPPLGALLKKAINKKEAEIYLLLFEETLIKVLINIRSMLKKKTRISFTAPYLLVDKKRVGCNIKKICEATSLNLFSLNSKEVHMQEFRDNQLVGREIFVLSNF